MRKFSQRRIVYDCDLEDFIRFAFREKKIHHNKANDHIENMQQISTKANLSIFLKH